MSEKIPAIFCGIAFVLLVLVGFGYYGATSEPTYEPKAHEIAQKAWIISVTEGWTAEEAFFLNIEDTAEDSPFILFDDIGPYLEVKTKDKLFKLRLEEVKP